MALPASVNQTHHEQQIVPLVSENCVNGSRHLVVGMSVDDNTTVIADIQKTQDICLEKELGNLPIPVDELETNDRQTPYNIDQKRSGLNGSTLCSAASGKRRCISSSNNERVESKILSSEGVVEVQARGIEATAAGETQHTERINTLHSSSSHIIKNTTISDPTQAQNDNLQQLLLGSLQKRVHGLSPIRFGSLEQPWLRRRAAVVRTRFQKLTMLKYVVSLVDRGYNRALRKQGQSSDSWSLQLEGAVSGTPVIPEGSRRPGVVNPKRAATNSDWRDHVNCEGENDISRKDDGMSYVQQLLNQHVASTGKPENIIRERSPHIPEKVDEMITVVCAVGKVYVMELLQEAMSVQISSSRDDHSFLQPKQIYAAVNRLEGRKKSVDI